MRLPYIQVTAETWDKAHQLGAALDEPMSMAFMRIVDLWAWGLGLGPKDQAPTGESISPRAAALMARAVWFKGDPAVLVEALSDLNLIEVLPDGIRVRGMDRYQRTWEKNHRPGATERKQGTGEETRHKPGTNPAQTRHKPGAPETRQNPAPQDPAPQTQTQTQTQTHIEKQQHLSAKTRTDESVAELQRAWNETTAPPIPRWDQTPKARKKLAGRALDRRALYGPDGWAAVFQRIQASSFCRGEDGGWKADIDWALRPEGKKPETALSVLEGKYDRANVKPTGPPKGAATQADKDWSKQPLPETPGEELKWG